jgi:preprotein translocase subunit SecG
MYQVIIVVHVLLGLGIVGLVLMQQGKGADAGAAFGSGSSGSVFGAQGSASFLSRTTAIFATLFFTTSLTLAILSGKQGKIVDIMEAVESSAAHDVPAAGKPKEPAVSAVTETPATTPALEVPAAVAVPAIGAAAAVAPLVDSAAKVSENKPAAEKKSADKAGAKSKKDKTAKSGKTKNKAPGSGEKKSENKK